MCPRPGMPGEESADERAPSPAGRWTDPSRPAPYGRHRAPARAPRPSRGRRDAVSPGRRRRTRRCPFGRAPRPGRRIGIRCNTGRPADHQSEIMRVLIRPDQHPHHRPVHAGAFAGMLLLAASYTPGALAAQPSPGGGSQKVFAVAVEWAGRGVGLWWWGFWSGFGTPWSGEWGRIGCVWLGCCGGGGRGYGDNPSDVSARPGGRLATPQRIRRHGRHQLVPDPLPRGSDRTAFRTSLFLLRTGPADRAASVWRPAGIRTPALIGGWSSRPSPTTWSSFKRPGIAPTPPSPPNPVPRRTRRSVAVC